MCDTSRWAAAGGARAQGLKTKHRGDGVLGSRNTNLEVVLLGFPPHDDVERLVRVLGAALDAAGHVLLVLVGVEPHSEGSAVSSQLGPRFGPCDKQMWEIFGGPLTWREFLLLPLLFVAPRGAPMARICISSGRPQTALHAVANC